jgi:leader peptidase (prepilin peptidase)/N-methyltransferase
MAEQVWLVNAFWLVLVFIIGTVIGSFLNVCIARLPLEKSLLWPGSTCGHCLQPIRWYDNLPLISYLWLRGRCRRCQARFSPRYLVVELLTGLGFVGLFYLEVMINIHRWPVPAGERWALQWGLYPWQWWVGFSYHAILFSLLLVAAACDLDGRQIPLSVTLPGALFGLLGAVLLPWPWPWTPEQALRDIRHWEMTNRVTDAAWWTLPAGPKVIGPEQGIYAWPVWGPLPDWLPPDSWQLGLATGLAGLLAGTLLLRLIAFLFGMGLGKEALGLGDADLMMMAGAFLGWQPVAASFFVAVFPALLVGVFQLVVRKDNSLPFGPSLALGVLVTMLCWRWIGPMTQQLFFWPVMLLALVGVGAGLMLGAAFFLRVTRPRQREEEPAAKA